MDYLAANRQNFENAADQLANSSTVSGEEDVVWIEEEEEGTGSVVIKEERKEGEQGNAAKKMELLEVASSKGGCDTTLSSSLETREPDRFPDEISGISVESEEQSEQQDDREIEPNRLMTTLENLVAASVQQDGQGESATSSSNSQKVGREMNDQNGSAIENDLKKLETAKEGQEIQMTIFPSSIVAASESKTKETEDSATTNKARNDKNGNGIDGNRQNNTITPSKVLDEFGWQMTATIIPIEREEEAGGKEASESISNEGKNDSAIQFSFKSIPKTETPPTSAAEELTKSPAEGESKAKEEEGIRNVEKGENGNKEAGKPIQKENGQERKDSLKDIGKDENTASKTTAENIKEEFVDKGQIVEKPMDPDATSSVASSSSQRGVRFADGQRSEGGTLKDQDLAKLEEYEEKMRRRSKEALELVDRICGLQAQEGEKRPALSKHIANEEPSNSRKSSANMASTDKDQLKEALAAGIHGLSGERTAQAKGETEGIPQQSAIQIGEGPVLDVESVSVSASILQSPSDCVLLPGQLLLIVDSDAGLSLISLESKQLVKQLSPKQGIWRNAECACIGGADGEHIYVLLEYNVNNSEAKTKAESAEGQPQNLEFKEGQRQNGSPGEEEKAKEEEAQKVQQNGGKGESSKKEEEAKSTNRGQPKGILKGKTGQNTEPTNNVSGRKNNEPDWRRFLCRFTVADFGMIDRLEAPKWLRERVVWNCRMCFVPQSQCLYLAANTPNQGFLFELRSAEGRWAECVGTRLHSQFADLHHFAVVGPVTELLLVETNRSFVQLVSIYNSTVVSSRTLGICERPGALCVDEKGNVLIFDRATSTVGLFSRAFLEKVCDLALVERAHCQLSARQGILAVLCRVTREVRMHRYGEKLRQVEEMLYEGGGMETI